MILVDTNILVPLLIPHENTERCQRLFILDPDWVLADWWQIECANVLRNLHRAGRITADDAFQAIGEAIRIITLANTHPVDLTESLRISPNLSVSPVSVKSPPTTPASLR